MTACRATNPGRLAGQVALVTGAASGIGRATAILLARQGAQVAVADLDESGAADTVQTIGAEEGIACAQRLDVTSESAWQKVTEQIEAMWGQLTLLVNCAGMAFAQPVWDMTLDEWRRVMSVNLEGTFLGTRAGIRAMRRAGRGSIINVASASGIKASPGASAYCASKAAVIMFSKTAALECVQQGDNIRINVIAPGAVKTALWSKIPLGAAIMASEAWNTPAHAPLGKRFAEPEEVAHGVLFLASAEASFVTGSVLAMDAGYTA